MLIRFRVENFRSIRDEQTLSLVADNLRGSAGPVVDWPQYRMGVLRVIGVYGANASGKSTVLSAMRFCRDAVLNSHPRWLPDSPVPITPFLLGGATRSTSSSFEVEFLLEGTRYRYGFAVDAHRVLEEWLFAYPQGRKQRWFVRDVSMAEEFSFSRSLLGENKAVQALTRPNSLYLSAAAQNNHKGLMPIYQWFRNSFSFVDEENKGQRWRRTVDMCRDEKLRGAVLRLMQQGDLGVADINIEDEDIAPEVQSMLEHVLAQDPVTLAYLRENPRMPQVTLLHGTSKHGEAVPLPFTTESKGTQAYFSLVGTMIQSLASGGILCVDELDSSLHPLMALEIVRVFNSPELNPNNAQLIFNTHDTNILEAAELRRDQVWFTEKDSDGATHLYPLTDYAVRRGENVKRGYLQGRYGAVPYVRAKSLLAAVRGPDA